jgi:hypothetical protein
MGCAAMTADQWVGIITINLSVFALYSSALAWLLGQNGKLRSETKKDFERLEGKECVDIGALRIEMGSRIDGVEHNADRSLDKAQAQEAKARHDLANTMQTGLFAVQQQVNQLRDGSATKPELAAVEQRLSAALNEFKVEARTEFGKIEQKVDRLPAMEAQLDGLTRVLETISTALSQRGLTL